MSPPHEEGRSESQDQGNSPEEESSGNSETIEPRLPPTSIDQATLISTCDLLLDEIKKSGVAWEELAAIFEDHARRLTDLSVTASYVSTVLQSCRFIHSVRTRIKSPEHLVRKVIRKRLQDDRRAITYHNYRSEVTDLIGIRALHLHKEDWSPIHEFITQKWDLIEAPIAYIREGDRQEWRHQFEACGCQVRPHPRNYRSVHYLIRSAPSKEEHKVEIQVRTIFEEAWSEIDHRINYPDALPYPSVEVLLAIFNRLAGTADEMGSFLRDLVADLQKRDQQAQAALQERDSAIERMGQVVKQLKISEKERGQLEKELRTLREQQAHPEGFMRLVTTPSYQPGTASSVLSASSFHPVFGKRTCPKCGHEFSPWITSTVATSSTVCPNCGLLM